MDDVIVLDDDDFLHLIANEPHRFESNHVPNLTASVKAEQAAEVTSNILIDLTDAFDDLNDLFTTNSSHHQMNANETDARLKAIKTEFELKNFNFNFDSSRISEILIDDDEEEEEQDEHTESSDGKLTLQSQKLSCQICSKTFAKLYNFKRHMFLHEAKLNGAHKVLKIDKCTFRVNQCEKCGREIADKSNFLRHVKSCQANKETLSLSGDLAVNRDTSATKELSLLGDKGKMVEQLVCEKCSKSFTKKFNLQRHLRVHFLRQLESNSSTFGSTMDDSFSGDELFECEKCARKFNESKQLEAHKAKWHSVSIKCKYCVNNESAMFTEKLDFIRHLNSTHSHLAIFRFECSICLKKFRFLSHYVQHRRSHFRNLRTSAESSRTIGLLKCDLCDKQFNKTFNLKRHMRTWHTTEIAE